MRERTIRYRPNFLINLTNRDGPFELFSAATMNAPIHSPPCLPKLQRRQAWSFGSSRGFGMNN